MPRKKPEPPTAKHGGVLLELYGMIAPGKIKGKPSYIHRLSDWPPPEDDIGKSRWLRGLARDPALVNQMYEDGFPLVRIGALFGMTHSMVVYVVDKYRRSTGRVPREEFIRFEIKECRGTIVMLRQKGNSIAAIAEELSIPDRIVKKICKPLLKKNRYRLPGDK